TATVGTSIAPAMMRRTAPRPGRLVNSSESASANMSDVDSAVQPLRSKTTWTMPAANGTVVTTSTAYQLRDPSLGRNVTMIATTSAVDATRHSTAMLLGATGVGAANVCGMLCARACPT